MRDKNGRSHWMGPFFIAPDTSPENETMTRDRDFYLDVVVNGYFGAMDSGDLEGTLACFAPNATLTWETNDLVLTGRDEIHAFFAEFIANTNMRLHEVRNAVVDTEKETCAVEIRYRSDIKDGPNVDMENCNFFDFGASGKFTRVHFWSGRIVA
jgi:ketosteroid isomerase-like protein